MQGVEYKMSDVIRAASVTLHDIAAGLIATSKEGVYWDFKREHHSDFADLLHDILCLANAEHDGDRYLIFGVEDDTMILRDISEDENRRTQAAVISFLRDNQNKFAEGHYPELRLETIFLDSSHIDILIIADSAQKPYYLVERIRGVNPYHIFTRTGDTNTPKDKSASPHQIEQMWRTRFGLNQPPLKRAKIYLSHFDDWNFNTRDTGCGEWWHKTFPEFTIRVEDCEFACAQEWTRGEIVTDSNHSNIYSFYYHQTRIAQIHWVTFDDGKKSMIAPKWEACQAGRFYFYDLDSLEYAMQLFHAHHNGGDHSKKLRSPSGDQEIYVVSRGELVSFLNAQQNHSVMDVCTDRCEQFDIFLANQKTFFDWRNDSNLSSST